MLLAARASGFLAALALATAAVLSGAAAAYHLITLRARKISIRRWLPK
jgi:ubiquinone biosynthesis protein